LGQAEGQPEHLGRGENATLPNCSVCDADDEAQRLRSNQIFRKISKSKLRVIETCELLMRLTGTLSRTNPMQTTSFLVSSSITLAIWIVVTVSVHQQPAVQQLMIVLLASIATALLYALLHESNCRGQREIELADKQATLIAINIELEESKKCVEQASTAKSIFLANMSHELKTPLNAIIGFSETLKNQAMNPAAMKNCAEYAEGILSSGHHLLELIGNILDISKIEAGKMSLDDELIEIADLAKASIALLGQRGKHKHITLETDLQEGVALIRGDELKLRQVLINLLSNAIKFTPDGGRVTIRVEPGRDGELVIAVADTGIGMSPDEIPIALEPFEQVDNGLAKAYDGTGIGLPLAKRLVELHGGKLAVESVKDAGTTIRAHLPANRVVPRAEVA
jgi:signal transduction histidine kinase